MPALFCSCGNNRGSEYNSFKVNIPWGVRADAYPGHVEISWNSSNGADYELWRRSSGKYELVAVSSSSPYLDFSIGASGSVRNFTYALCPKGLDPLCLEDTAFVSSHPRAESLLMDVLVPAASDSLLIDAVQRYTTRYFTDFAEPYSGMARERSNDTKADIVTIGGSGFGLMALIAAQERQYVTDEQAIEQYDRILNFLETVERFHGAWAHWYDADTRKPFSFSKYDDGGDLVETAFMAQGLIALRQHLRDSNPQLSRRADRLWREIEWDWYTRDNSDSLYWHWSRNWGWKMNHRIKGYDECLITYVLAASSPTHPIPARVYESCYKTSTYYHNGKEYYGIPLTIGMEYGGPLFFTHYSFLGLDPRGLNDGLTDYWERGRAHSLIHYNYAKENPKGHEGLGENLWGFTSSDDPMVGYTSHHPCTEAENGTVSPTAALSSIVYTPEESLRCLRHLYYDLGNLTFGKMGFYDAYNPSMVEGEQVVRSYLAIDQGPIAVMMENYRSGLLWELFMSAPEIPAGLAKLGFTVNETNQNK